MHNLKTIVGAGLPKLLKNSVVLFLALFATVSYAQDTKESNKKHAEESYDHTLNIGIGAGYYSYMKNGAPLIIANYEFPLLHNFTLAPFLGYSSYRNYNIDPISGLNYYYHETSIPFGAKGTYYFDELLNAGIKWDFYAAASIGMAYNRLVWGDGYTGTTIRMSPVFINLHVGVRYHISNKVGAFIDLSSGGSTIGCSLRL